jgi:DNA-binding transcriptional LysR family regulator
MMKLEGIGTFVAVADSGSLSEAARRLRLSKSVVSERLAGLERTLGASLLQRSTRRMSLTDEGTRFLERARHILKGVAEAAEEISEHHRGLCGPLRISAPVSFGALHLGPALFPFLKRNPSIELTLDLDDRFVEATAAGYDAIIRHGPVRDSRLVVKRLAASRRVLVAAPAYLETQGSPRSLAELQRHRAILYTPRGSADWRFAMRKGKHQSVVVRPQTSIRLNNGLLIRDAAIAGLGIALLPTFLVSAPLASGQLRALEVGVEPEGAVLYIAYPANRRASAKVSELTASLRLAFGDPPYWDREVVLPQR